jgi:hypothetical protein
MLKSPIFTSVCLIGLLFAAVVVAARWQTNVSLAAWPAISAAPSASDVAVPGVQAGELVEGAIRLFQNCDSVAATINLEINFLGYDLVGSGIYLEQDPARGHRLRMELSVQRSDHAFTMLQVCDGHYLWSYRQRTASPEVTRINLAKISRAHEQRDGKPFWPDDLTGMATYLRRLRNAFDFDAVEALRSAQGQSLWRIRGHWKPGWLAVILPEQKLAIEQGKAADLGMLPAYAPDEVVVYLRQEDLFPCTFEYCRTLQDKDGGRKTSVITAMWLTNIRLNIPIDTVRFNYNPGDLKPMDQTQWYMQNVYGLTDVK